jgi:deoxyribodipyrimidine photo-lyase
MILYNTSIFIFRRDLRINDNLGLIRSHQCSKSVLPIFIFTPEQVGKGNMFKSNNAVQFMIESLVDLDKQLRKNGSHLYMFYGDNIQILRKLIKSVKPEAIFFNKDFTPYSLQRDSKIKRLCQTEGLTLHMLNDLCLNPVGKICTKKGTGYKRFTPFYNTSKKIPVPKPMRGTFKNYYKKGVKVPQIKKSDLKKFFDVNLNIKSHGGRQAGKNILNNIIKFKDYDKTRNFPNIETTMLSPHNKFGTVSIREVYHIIKKGLGDDNNLLRQLYWRDFYIHFGYFNLNMYTDHYVDHKFKFIRWKTSKTLFNAWKRGLTGFPLCDAGMRELNVTGFMHNRVRMIAATVLCRILLIDWRLGEKYFSKKLTDHDRASNDGNWMWVAGVSPHAQEYYRIMTPKSQTLKFDPDCKYIKKWIPELASVPVKDIINWDVKYKDHRSRYPDPIVDYKKNKFESIKRYKASIEKYTGS